MRSRVKLRACDDLGHRSPPRQMKKPMSKTQYRATTERLGLSQAAAAKLLGVSLRTSHGYANGEPIPDMVSTLLRLLAAGKITVKDIEAAHER